MNLVSFLCSLILISSVSLASIPVAQGPFRNARSNVQGQLISMQKDATEKNAALFIDVL